MRTITDEVLVSLDLPADRTPIPADAIASFLASRKTFRCEALAALITPEACAFNRRRPEHEQYPCRTCNQERPKVEPAAKRHGQPAKLPGWQQSNQLKKEQIDGTVRADHAPREAGDGVSLVASTVSRLTAVKAGRQAGRQAGRHFLPNLNQNIH
jgi:hypothetical protein